MANILILGAIAVFGGALLGWRAWLNTKAQARQLQQLTQKVEQLERALGVQGSRSEPANGEVAPAAQSRSTVQTNASGPKADGAALASAIAQPDTVSASRASDGGSAHPLNTFIDNLKQNWMTWLGGVSVGLAGIFMVRYSIESGLLGPTARVVLGVLAGVVLHSVAYWLRLHRGEHQSFAALAGGASITLYAALLAAMHFYQLLSPGAAFALLALVSLVTMLLSLKHGPVLAILGLLGGYVVPILVSTGSGNILAALIYAQIISMSALVLMRWVYRPWLWWGTVAGALGWWYLSLSLPAADAWRGVYLFATAYALISVPRRDWLLRFEAPLNTQEWKLNLLRADVLGTSAPLFGALMFIVGAQTSSILAVGYTANAIVAWVPLFALLHWLAQKQEKFLPLVWFVTLCQLGAWLAVGARHSGWSTQGFEMAITQQADFFSFALVMAGVGAGLSFLGFARQRFMQMWAALMLTGPLLWLGLVYLVAPQLALDWQFALLVVALGIGYSGLASRQLKGGGADVLTVWLLLSAHLAWALAAAMVFNEATLTLAIAAQAWSLAWVMKRFEMMQLAWLLKVVLAVVVLRLSFNPWLASYSSEVHWSLYTYGGSSLFALLALVSLRDDVKLRPWLELVTLHLTVLTIWAELRYWLYDGQIFIERYGFIEAAINANLWVAVGLIYHHRAQLSVHFTVPLSWASRVLLLAGTLNYALLLTSLNPIFDEGGVSPTPVWNELLLAFGLPVILATVAWRTLPGQARQIALGMTALAAFVFVNMEIRHLWNGDVSMYLNTPSGELYTYSIVWLGFAVFAMLTGRARGELMVYRAGIALLALVIAKIFLIDMSGLDGLLRVASFMGLGLSLLGLAYLLQRQNPEQVHLSEDD